MERTVCNVEFMIVDMNMENAWYGARLKQLVEHLIGLL